MSLIQVPIVRPDVGEEEIAEVARVIRSGWIMQGPEVAAFEQELASHVGARHAVAVSSGTAALELALRVLGVGPGDEVITVSHSFIATANVCLAVGARPVFVDVDETTMGMDPARARAAIGPRTKAILAAHQLGMPCDIAAICALGLPVVEDAACAVGSEIQLGGRWQKIGRPVGRIACFSFHPRKIVTTGDGGMLTTDDAALAEHARRLRQHAMRPGDHQRAESFTEPAFNFRMTDLQAAVGRPQLRRLEATVARRRELAERYHETLRRSRAFRPPEEPAWARSNWQSYPAMLKRPQDQAQIMERLKARGVATRRGVSNAHQEPAYAGTGRFGVGPGGLPVSERLRNGTILLPLFHNMTPDEEFAVLDAVQEVEHP